MDAGDWISEARSLCCDAPTYIEDGRCTECGDISGLYYEEITDAPTEEEHNALIRDAGRPDAGE